MTPETTTDQDRRAVEAELRCLADDEFVMAERYTDWQVRGPTLEDDISIANIAQDELGHARLWYDLLEGFGYDETDLIWERPPEDFRHATLAELPYVTGDWADCVLRGYLYDTHEHLRLAALADSTYDPIADRIEKVKLEEHYHREFHQNWLDLLTADPTGRDRLQSTLDRIYPHALTLFAPTDHEDTIVTSGIRPVALNDLRADWHATTTPYLEGIGLEPPEPDPDQPIPHPRGRDGNHTNHWPALYDEFTQTYRLLDRDHAPRLMPRPDETDDD